MSRTITIAIKITIIFVIISFLRAAILSASFEIILKPFELRTLSPEERTTFAFGLLQSFVIFIGKFITEKELAFCVVVAEQISLFSSVTIIETVPVPYCVEYI
jgi:hypothetical protein